MYLKSARIHSTKLLVSVAMYIPKSIDEYRKNVGERIKKARLMAGFNTATELCSKIPGWTLSRVSNYEGGVSAPSPLDILKIADVTDTNPGWLTYGMGPIRSNNRDIQSIRHQNYRYLIESVIDISAQAQEFRAAVKLKPKEVKNLFADPSKSLTATLCRKIERFLDLPSGWMDEQQIVADGSCSYFPDEIKELLAIYSSLDKGNRGKLLEIAAVLSK